tara:strand:- start:49 stop:405 length:357 start_codon:yes stop_codon:yes gene_type:complete
MPILQFTFSNQLNVSVQIGDVAYYVPTSTSSQFQVNSSDIIEIGTITYINPDGLGFWCSTMLASAMYPSSSDYIFFAKDNKVNQSNTLGYYAKVRLKNNSKEKAEVYSVAADCFESSK